MWRWRGASGTVSPGQMPHSFFDVVELAGRFPKANIIEQLMSNRAVDGEGRHTVDIGMRRLTSPLRPEFSLREAANRLCGRIKGGRANGGPGRLSKLGLTDPRSGQAIQVVPLAHRFPSSFNPLCMSVNHDATCRRRSSLRLISAAEYS